MSAQVKLLNHSTIVQLRNVKKEIQNILLE